MRPGWVGKGMERLGVVAGEVVAGKYRLDELLGQGAMGSVWCALHLELGSPVALKVLKPDVFDNPTARARFLREAKAAARLRSPHVVQILDHGEEGTLAYIAMELLEGESLRARLEREGKLSPTLTATIVTHVARAIGRAHDEGITHRDLKPGNVFLVPNEDETVVKVLDFGIAKSSVEELDSTGSPATKTGALLGTPYYMSPEQAAGDKSVDHRTDLWALGVIAYECLCGQRPFQSAALGDLVLRICVKPLPVPSAAAEVPAGFDRWFARAVARDPAERFQSARQMSRELAALLGGPAPSMTSLDTAPPDGVPTADRPSASSGGAAPDVPGGLDGGTLEPLTTTATPRRRLLLGVGGAVALLAAGLGAALAVSFRPPSGGTTGDQAPATASASSAAAPGPEPEPASTAEPEPAAAADAGAADAQPSEAGGADPPAPRPPSRPRRPPPAAPRPAPPPKPPPPTPPVDDDPLGI